jgi:hypothetical protein
MAPQVNSAHHQEGQNDEREKTAGAPFLATSHGFRSPRVKERRTAGGFFLFLVDPGHPERQAAFRTEFLSGPDQGAATGARPGRSCGRTFQQLAATLTESLFLSVD